MASALSTAKSLAKYNNDLERSNVALQYQYNRSLAQEDRSWQERMSNSAHQREIADLKKAGLNPVLSVTGGNGASTPSGSSASVSKANVDMSLPRAVMDMAVAQLNSATQLQTTAMQTSNALTIAREQMASDYKRHITPSGDSKLGQSESFVQKFGKYSSDFASLLGRNVRDNPTGIDWLDKIIANSNSALDSYEFAKSSKEIDYRLLKMKETTDGLSRKERRQMRQLKRYLRRNRVDY